MIKNYLPLVHALIDAFLFLENAGDTEVDPDSAVRCMEHMSSSLLVLGEADQFALREHFVKIAEELSGPGVVKFVRELPDMIGLARRGE